MADRAQHLAWAQARALKLVDEGDLNGALASIASDLGKHPDTAGHLGIELGMVLLIGGQLSTPHEVRHHIEGFA